jgi:hypothetical protein
VHRSIVREASDKAAKEPGVRRAEQRAQYIRNQGQVPACDQSDQANTESPQRVGERTERVQPDMARQQSRGVPGHGKRRHGGHVGQQNHKRDGRPDQAVNSDLVSPNPSVRG